MLQELLESIVLANNRRAKPDAIVEHNCRAKPDAIVEHDAGDYMNVFATVLSEGFESSVLGYDDSRSLSRQLSNISTCNSEADGTGEIVMDQQIVAVSRRQYRAHVNAIGRLTKSLKTYENQFEH